MAKITWRQFSTYTRAVKRHIETGRIRRTDQEVEDLLAICKNCENYSDGRCTICGCRCNAGKIAYFNKLRMASEHCPADKW